MRKIWDIPGGVHPPENKSQSNQNPIRSITLPKEIILPLNQHIGAEALPCVELGQHVLKGQMVAEPQGVFSAALHASTSGTVIAIEDRPLNHASGMSAQCIVIESDGKDEWATLTPCEDYRTLDHTELANRIRNAGIAGLGGAGFPTAIKLNPSAEKKVKTLILNGTECEPYITADDMLMRECAEEVVQGALLMAHILGEPEEILIGIEDNKPEAIAEMQKAADNTRVEIVVFPTKYPSGGEKQLIQILTGKEVPKESIPATIGVVVQNVGTAATAYRAIRYGEPLVRRITTVVGKSLQAQGNIEALIGTPIAHLLNESGFNLDQCARLIIGGPMMGYAMQRTDIPLIKTTNCVLVPDHEEMPTQADPQACIRCGMCSEACPASLLPQQLYWFSQSEDVDKLRSHNLFDCIECGACSFVCPSNIPLVQYYRASKGMIKQMEADKIKSDRSRVRFEHRKERLEKAEAEKEAKRLARKKAAEEAKKKLAEKAEASSDTPAAAEVKTAEKTPVKQIDPATQLKKLERALSSATSRVERATTQLENAKAEGEDARIDTLEARLKEANLKRDEAKQKLDEFNSGSQAPNSATNTTIKEKIALNPIEKQEKTITTLKQRIETAKQKHQEALDNNTGTADALQKGIEKLQEKRQTAEKELAEIKQSGDSTDNTEAVTETLNAADAAIAKAKAKAQALASMSDTEKAQAQIESLKARLDKARERLAKAEAENSEHIDAFKSGVEKLEKKLAEAQS
ncbi:MAG: electron transport complex subunit RsxC [Agarilytica sp.]